MEIAGLGIDSTQNMPVVLLKDVADGENVLPIWIGVLEATAIAMKLEEVEVGRPMTHDLLKNVLDEMGAVIDRVVISDLSNNTYFARIHVTAGEKSYEFDSRPSDAMALALRAGVKIFVDSSVIEKTRGEGDRPSMSASIDPKDKEKWLEILENMDPDDFGKYKI
jgi:bifunctional DNase/RNase